MPAFAVRIRTKINLQKGPLRFDKLFIIVIMKMSFLRGGAAKGLAVPPHFYKNPTFIDVSDFWKFPLSYSGCKILKSNTS